MRLMNVIVGRLDRGARATGAAGATPPVAQTVWRQHGGSTGAARGQHGGSTGEARGQHGGSTAAARRQHGGARGQHGGNRLPFLPEPHFEICALFTGIGIYNYF